MTDDQKLYLLLAVHHTWGLHTMVDGVTYDGLSNFYLELLKHSITKSYAGYTMWIVLGVYVLLVVTILLVLRALFGEVIAAMLVAGWGAASKWMYPVFGVYLLFSILGVFLIMRLRRKETGSRQQPITTCYRPQLGQGVVPGSQQVLLLGALVLIMGSLTLVDDNLQKQHVVLITGAVLITFSFFQLFTTVGQNSMWQALIVVMVLLAMLLSMPAVQMILTAIINRAAKIEEEAATTRFPTALHSYVSGFQDVIFGSVTRATKMELTRTIIGYLVVGTMATDEVRGVTELTRMITRMVGKDNYHVDRMLAGNFMSPWVMAACMEAVYAFWAFSPERLMCVAMGLVLGWYLQGQTLALAWIGRGAQQIFVKLRPGMDLPVGDGFIGMRKALMVCIVAVVLLTYAIDGYFEWLFAYSLLSVFFITSDRLIILMLGYLTSNLALIYIGLMDAEPLKSAVRANTSVNERGGIDGIGANSGLEPPPTPVVTQRKEAHTARSVRTATKPVPAMGVNVETGPHGMSEPPHRKSGRKKEETKVQSDVDLNYAQLKLIPECMRGEIRLAYKHYL